MRAARCPILMVLVLAASTSACGSSEVAVETSPDVARGAELFEANCATCHGVEAGGTDQGPPLIHELYVPSHHADASFQVAVTRGVQPHHWDFGPMAPVEGLTAEDVTHIVAYVRQLQRDAGLIE